MEFLLGFTAGSLIMLIGLCTGYSLGKSGAIVGTDTKKQINQIFKRVVPRGDVGVVERPTQRDNFYRDNPGAYEADQEMTQGIDNLNS